MIAIVASTFPRFENDTEPRFILDFAENLHKTSPVTVYVPHHPLAQDHPPWTSVPIVRFNYWPWPKSQTLCGDGGIPAKSKTLKGKIQVLALIVAEIRLFLRLLANPKISHIHVNWILPQGLAFAIASLFRRSQAKTILSFHSGRAENKSSPYLLIEKFVLSRFNAITINNRQSQVSLSRRYERRIELLPMGLTEDVQTQKPSLKKDYQRLVSIGRFVPVKGYVPFLKAWASHRSVLKEYHLTLIGKGPGRGQIEELISSEKLENVSLLVDPPRNEIFKHLDTCGYYVQPSLVLPSGDTEGFGVSVLEGLYFGCTPLVTKAGGLPDTLPDSQYAFASAEEIIIRLANKKITPWPPQQSHEHSLNFSWSRRSLKPLFS